MSESANQGSPSQEATGSAVQSEAGSEAAKTSMWEYNFQTQQWAMTPESYQFFANQINILNILRDTINDKWNEHESTAYLTHIQNIYSYITYYVYGQQVQYFEDYQAGVNYYAKQNPIGAKLYENQFDYLKYLQKRQLKEENKKNKPKDTNQQQQKPKEVVRVQKEQKIVVRSGDPEINIQKLMSTDWDSTKYVSTSILAKENANIVFIGHVDSGKSTLTGNIIKELKEIDQQQLSRNKIEVKQNKMEAWESAAVSDIIPEERVDGKTREYAKMNFTLQKKRFTLFDAPGHKNYVPNMIMGACQADIAVLIISAKEGEFESGFQKDGQTKQHAMLAKALGVVELIAVVSKMGTVNWDEKRFMHIKEQVTPFLENSCGFHNVTFIPIESIETANIHKPLENSWYKGSCLLDYLDNIKLPERKPMGPLRIPVIDKFKDIGNLFAYGKIQSGTVIQDQIVTILPQRQQMVIKQIFNAKDERLPFGYAGDNVKLKVKNIDENDISRGDMICNNLNYCQEAAQLKAKITILELPEEKKLVSSGYQCVIHMHAIAAQVEISKVQAKVDIKTGKKLPFGFLKAGQKGICQLKIERPICLQKFEFMPSLGRFTLRDEGKTIGYGEIIGLKPAKLLYDEQKEHLGKKEEKIEKEGESKKIEQKQ